MATVLSPGVDASAPSLLPLRTPSNSVHEARLAGLLGLAGLTSVFSSLFLLWLLWTTDALKSIGIMAMPVGVLLLVRVWRSLCWEMHGSWWGFAILCLTAMLVKLRESAVLLLVLSPEWNVYFPPHSLVVFAYGAGFVLLFGGVRLFRAALFPLLLLFFVNPVPHLFNVYVDLPLQRISAHIARGFAMALGQPLSPDKLRLMFTPEFGMFIAPGCNGIRGAVTMGFIALVAGYLYRFRLRSHLLIVAGAVAMGYAFNLVRLCVLVLYYIVALHWPTLQDKAENADYVIGAGLFAIAVYVLYFAIQRLRNPLDNPDRSVWVLPEQPENDLPAAARPVAFRPRAIAMGVLALIGSVNVGSALLAPKPAGALEADATAMGQFPAHIGDYTLARSWNENLVGGALLFHWAEYAPADGGTRIAVGVSPLLGSHDTLVCHSARGEDPLWRGPEALPTAAGAEPVSFSAAFFNDGATQYLEASTLCTGSSCGEYATGQRHFGLVFSKPHPEALLSQHPDRTIPVLLRVETADTTVLPDVARAQLEGSLRRFVAGVNVEALTRPYRRQ